jgi:hypothetical protein
MLMRMLTAMAGHDDEDTKDNYDKKAGRGASTTPVERDGHIPSTSNAASSRSDDGTSKLLWKNSNRVFSEGPRISLSTAAEKLSRMKANGANVARGAK